MVAGTSTAGVFDPLNSTLLIQLGGLPPFPVTGTYQHGGWATLTNNGSGHDLSDTQSIWVTQGLAIGTSLLTGVGLITKLTLTGTNLSGSFTASFTSSNHVAGSVGAISGSNTLCATGACLGGPEGFNGQFVMALAGLTTPSFPLSKVGLGGTNRIVTISLPNVGGATIKVTNNPFVSGKAVITGVTSNLVSLPDRGGVTGAPVTLRPAATENVKTFTTGNAFVTSHPGAPLSRVNTIVTSGTNSLSSASGTGMVTLISPMRINTGPLGVGNIPAVARKKFSFVPEPGTVLLLVSGAAGLIFIGRKRMKS